MADTIYFTSFDFGFNESAESLKTKVQNWINDNALTNKTYAFQIVGNTLFVMAW